MSERLTDYRLLVYGAPSYLETAPVDKRLLTWVHLFSPHEPYENHPEFPFGERDLDRYDSEVRSADETVGALVAAFRAKRPSSVVIVTADHGMFYRTLFPLN